MSEFFKLYEDFYADKFAKEKIIRDTKRLIGRFYNVRNLQSHAAYFADISDNRSSYAFIFCPENKSNLPAFSLAEVAEVSRPICTLTLRLYEMLGLSKNARVLFNIQMYKGDSKPVAKHFDGEFLKFDVDGEHLNIHKAIRPQKVAVLTMINHTIDGGTRLHLDSPDLEEQSTVVKGKSGDLLIFDNIKCHHSVDKLESDGTKRDDGLIRMIIGWRSIDENCGLYENGVFTHSDCESIRELHANWLKNEWPKMFENYVLENQKVAF